MTETTSTARHRDDRFPKAESPHACTACREGRHEKCSPVIQVGPFDQEACECRMAAPQRHEVLEPRTVDDADGMAAALNSVLGTDAVHTLMARVLADRGYAIVVPGRRL